MSCYWQFYNGARTFVCFFLFHMFSIPYRHGCLLTTELFDWLICGLENFSAIILKIFAWPMLSVYDPSLLTFPLPRRRDPGEPDIWRVILYDIRRRYLQNLRQRLLPLPLPLLRGSPRVSVAGHLHLHRVWPSPSLYLLQGRHHDLPEQRVLHHIPPEEQRADHHHTNKHLHQISNISGTTDPSQLGRYGWA